MTLYKKYYYNSDKDSRLWEAQQMAVKKCKDKFMEGNNAVYVFDDDSRLIFTSDNIQVSLF